MGLTIKYIPVFVKDISATMSFFTEILGFAAVKNLSISANEVWTLLKVSDKEENYMVFLEKGHGKNKENPVCNIIINTDDCLRDYHLFKNRGVCFSGEPQYLNIGLCVNFTDPAGNQFTLLEERDYQDG